MTSAPVVLPALSGRQAQAWDVLMSVAGSLGEGWTLIGGQMVLLHQSERQPEAAHAAPGAAQAVLDLGDERSQAATAGLALLAPTVS